VIIDSIDWAPPPTPLSRREQEVLAALMEGGATNKEIGQRLFLSEKTVKFHIRGAMRKLGAANRTHLAIIACRQERDA